MHLQHIPVDGAGAACDQRLQQAAALPALCQQLVFQCAGPPKPLARVPAWLKRPVSGALGFAGKLATVTNSRKGEEPDAPVTAQLAVKQVVPRTL